jgi:glycosyltransferase involved in cell wall biosynthesis
MHEHYTHNEAPEPLRVALFTDTLGDVNGVSRFVQNIAACAERSGRSLHVVTCTRKPCPAGAGITNFRPRIALPMPGYPDLDVVLPPARAMLAHGAGLRPHAVHVSTPGPVGVLGLMTARRLGVPVLGEYHTDFPAYVSRLFDDAAMTRGARVAMGLFYRRFARVFTRSEDYRAAVVRLGVAESRLRTLVPGVDTDLFHPRHADPGIWTRLAPGGAGVKVLYVGRLSVEKGLPFLARVWPLVRSRSAAAGIAAELIVVGDGPYRGPMEDALGGHGARFLGFRFGGELSALYASSDLLVFPSVTDTLGQVVMESQATGLPVLVSDVGGPKEVVAPGRTGYVLPAGDAGAWAAAIVDLCRDATRRRAMGAGAHRAMQSLSISRSFENFWGVHEEARRGADAGPGK